MFTPPVTLADLWPPDAAVAIRPDDDAVDWLSPSLAWRERITAIPVPLAGGLPVVCHEAASTPAALQLLRHCGLPADAPVLRYATAEERRAHLARLAAGGRKIGAIYGARRAELPAEAHVNHPDTVAALNDKANLAELLPPDCLPTRAVVPGAGLAAALEARGGALPLVLKAASPLGSAGGLDVAICRTPDDLAPACGKLARAERVVIEEYCSFEATWCLHYAASDAGVSFVGATEQVCDAAGAYLGNWREEGSGPGGEAVELGWAAALAGWVRGYRGFVGIDAGRTPDGRWVAFDPNFRLNGSTLQALVGPTLAGAWGRPCSRMVNGVAFPGGFDRMLERLAAFHQRRELLPTLLFDGPRLGLANGDGSPACNLLVAGADRTAVGEVFRRLRDEGFRAPAA